MNTKILIILLLLLPLSIAAQVIEKPIGCFAGTNGTHPDVLAHTGARGVLLLEKWSNIETKPGIYDFSLLNSKINQVKAAGLKYSLAIAGGAFGSPDWLIDSLKVAYSTFMYKDKNWRLPLWWNPICEQKLTELINRLGFEYATDDLLSHVYVTQMTSNGIEGHLNGVDMADFTVDGYTEEKWISAAENTAYTFANAFPDKPIVFEIHEIDHSIQVPATIINDLSHDEDLCGRVGLGMWWISGKTTYQSDLIDYIASFEGDKYAQVIGRSDQPERFKDSSYSSVFEQAKHLKIRYIEPWPYEFQFHTSDSLIYDFNTWADEHFSSTDTCSKSSVIESFGDYGVTIYPNPSDDKIQIFGEFDLDSRYEITDIRGAVILVGELKSDQSIEISDLPKGLYFLIISTNKKIIAEKFIKE